MLETREPVGLALGLDVGKINADATINPSAAGSPKTRNPRKNGQAQKPNQATRKKGLAISARIPCFWRSGSRRIYSCFSINFTDI